MASDHIPVQAMPGDWVRPLRHGPWFDPAKVYYVFDVIDGRIQYGMGPEAQAKVYGPRPEDYEIVVEAQVYGGPVEDVTE